MSRKSRFISGDEIESIEALGHKASPAQVQALISEIRGLQSKASDLDCELSAVMQLAVEKWEDAGEAEGLNPATRAANAREKALKAIEREREATTIRLTLGDIKAEIEIRQMEIIKSHAPQAFIESSLRMLFDECLRAVTVRCASPLLANSRQALTEMQWLIECVIMARSGEQGLDIMNAKQAYLNLERALAMFDQLEKCQS